MGYAIDNGYEGYVQQREWGVKYNEGAGEEGCAFEARIDWGEAIGAWGVGK